MRVAAFITPALVQGGLLNGRAPVDLGEADHSQTGKGYRNKLTAAIYNHSPRAISQQRSGIGSLEEAFDAALIAGSTFISLDNVRGKIESQKIESFLTEDCYYARAAYLPNTEIDPRQVYVMFTSNKADMTDDLANRSSCVRILKQPEGFLFPRYAEGDVLAHVRANQPRFLGAVFAVVRAWHAAGKPRTDEARHDFREWAQTLDWIVQFILGAAPLMDGHRETQQRMTNPALNWLRDVAIAAVKQRQGDRWLLAVNLLDVIDADGSIAMPGLKEGGDVEDDGVRRNILQQIGRKLGRCFGDRTTVTLDGLDVERDTFTDANFRQRWQYRVLQASFADLPSAPSLPPDGFVNERAIAAGAASTEPQIDDAQRLSASKSGAPAIAPPDDPLMRPLVNSRDPADPANDSQHLSYARTHTHARIREAAMRTNSGVSGVSGVSGHSESIGVSPAEPCPRCGGVEIRDFPLRGGRGARRDCAICGHTLDFPEWHATNGSAAALPNSNHRGAEG